MNWAGSWIVRSLEKVWVAKDLSTRTKAMMCRTLVQPVLLYNAETWTLKQLQTKAEEETTSV